MGNKSSRPDVEVTDNETAFFAPQSPVQFGEGLISQLAEQSGPGPSAARQETLDAHVQQKIQAELKRLRAEEADVRAQIEAALERENIEREGSSSSSQGEGASSGGLLHSATLLRDLEELEKRTTALRDRNKKDMNDSLWSALNGTRKDLLQCFRDNKDRPLDCHQQKHAFVKAVSALEKNFVEAA